MKEKERIAIISTLFNKKTPPKRMRYHNYMSFHERERSLFKYGSYQRDSFEPEEAFSH